MPFRQVTISGGRTAGLAAALTTVRAQHPPYLPAHAAIVRLATGQTVLSIEFAAPSPLGLLQTQPPQLTGRHPVSAR